MGKISFVTLYNALTKNDVLAYLIDVIVDNLSEDRVRYFAKMGIVNFMDSLSDKKHKGAKRNNGINRAGTTGIIGFRQTIENGFGL